jgi:glycosyltransferase involved in cell wall biosynthesis
MRDLLVSVVIWTYNHSEFIAESIESVLAQERDFDLEVIIGDDFSTDGARDIIKVYAEQHSFIKLVFPGKNIGPNENVIQTLSACTGKYVAFIDGDDFWCDRRKLLKQVNVMEFNHDISLCFHNVRIKGGVKDGQLAYLPNRKKYISSDDLMLGDFTHTNATMVRNKEGMFTPIINKVLTGADTVLFLLPLIDGDIGYFSSDVMSAYRVHAGGSYSLQSVHSRFLQNESDLLSLLAFFKDSKSRELLQRKYSSLLFSHSIELAQQLNLLRSTLYYVRYVFVEVRLIKFKKAILPFAIYIKSLSNLLLKRREINL